MTAEEFFRDKIRELYPDQKHITLWKQEINCETAMRWSHEYAEEVTKIAAEKQIEEHQTEISNLEYDLKDKTDECNELEKTVAQLEDEVDALEDYIKELKQTINDSE